MLDERANENVHALATPAGFGDCAGDGKSSEASPLDACQQDLLRRAILQNLQKFLRHDLAADGGVEHHSAANGYHRRELADDEAVAGQRQQQPRQPQPGESVAAGL